jgi:hypothetical protein
MKFKFNAKDGSQEIDLERDGKPTQILTVRFIGEDEAKELHKLDNPDNGTKQESKIVSKINSVIEKIALSDDDDFDAQKAHKLIDLLNVYKDQSEEIEETEGTEDLITLAFQKIHERLRILLVEFDPSWVKGIPLQRQTALATNILKVATGEISVSDGTFAEAMRKAKKNGWKD